MITENDILRSFEHLEDQGLFVSRLMLTREVWKNLEQPREFHMARVIVGQRNVAMSAPEFFGYAAIPFVKKKIIWWKEILKG